MTVTLTGSLTKSPVAGGAAPSKGSANDLRGTVRGWDENQSTFAIVVGAAASAPATYADLTSPVVVETLSAGFGSITISQQGGGTAAISFSDSLDDLSGGSWSVGTQLWLCAFASNSPTGTDAVKASVRLPALVT
jgi:hypothetical protein